MFGCESKRAEWLRLRIVEGSTTLIRSPCTRMKWRDLCIFGTRVPTKDSQSVCTLALPSKLILMSNNRPPGPHAFTSKLPACERMGWATYWKRSAVERAVGGRSRVGGSNRTWGTYCRGYQVQSLVHCLEPAISWRSKENFEVTRTI